MSQQTDKAYLVVEDFGVLGRAFVETDVRQADRDTVIQDILHGQRDNPVAVYAVDGGAEVSAEIAQAVFERAKLMLDTSQGLDHALRPGARRFCELHHIDMRGYD